MNKGKKTIKMLQKTKSKPQKVFTVSVSGSVLHFKTSAEAILVYESLSNTNPMTITQSNIATYQAAFTDEVTNAIKKVIDLSNPVNINYGYIVQSNIIMSTETKNLFDTKKEATEAKHNQLKSFEEIVKVATGKKVEFDRDNYPF